MANYNRFGATYDKVIELYPGTVTTDYATNSITGDVIIGRVLDRVTRDVARVMPPAVFDALTRVEAEQAVVYATSGQTSLTLGLAPVTTGTVHLWRFPSLAALELPSRGYGGDDWPYRRPVMGLNEIASADYNVTASTGAVALTGSLSAGLLLGERIYASYTVDVENTSFSVPSLADVIVYGAAAELGSKLYSEEAQAWKLVTDYQARYAAFATAAAAGAFVPDEVRRLKYWQDIKPRNAEVGSVRTYRV